MTDFLGHVEHSGFAIVPNRVTSTVLDQILAQVAEVKGDDIGGFRSGKAFGIRNLLTVAPATRALANSDSLRSLVMSVLGKQARVVRGIYLDKHKDANWKVAWHQDLTIAVRERKEVDSYGQWSMKAGIQHVQPPVRILENMLAVRVHLDDTDESNGALRVVPGSHLHGRLSAEEIQVLRAKSKAVSCPIKRGDLMLMRPLILHASSVATQPGHRRVLHFEYAVGELDGGLEWYEEEL